MTVETETILIKLLERIEQKLDRFIETTQKDMTDLNVGQARLEEKTSPPSSKVKTALTINSILKTLGF